jgi:hypothetical protein
MPGYSRELTLLATPPAPARSFPAQPATLLRLQSVVGQARQLDADLTRKLADLAVQIVEAMKNKDVRLESLRQERERLLQRKVGIAKLLEQIVVPPFEARPTPTPSPR